MRTRLCRRWQSSTAPATAAKKFPPIARRAAPRAFFGSAIATKQFNVTEILTKDKLTQGKNFRMKANRVM
jgi:hypothetical protein